MLKNRFFLVALHLIFGVVLTISILSKLISLSVLMYAIYDIISSKNENNQSFLWASYFVSAEVLLRMTGGALSWELVKYIVVLLLTIGLLIEKRLKGVPIVFLLYIFLLLIGVVFTEIPVSESLRKAIVFNLSGPITLGVSAIYFYKRPIDFTRFKEIIFVSLLPILSMLTLLYFKTPSLKEITFGTQANFAASGGFGPNQVATALGYGIFLIAVLLLLKEKISGNVFFDIFLLFYLIFRGLLTFSRGGIITGFVAFISMSLLYLLHIGKIKNLIKYIGIVIISLVSIWIYSTNLTGGVLQNRYLGQNSNGEQKEDMSSGRVDIFEKQLESFIENPIFGIGVGSGKFMRQEKYSGHVTAASHNEIGRLIEEHGLIGILAIILLIGAFINNFITQPLYFKGFVLSFAALWFLTINHSAMRIAFPGFIYGLSLINIYKEEDLI